MEVIALALITVVLLVALIVYSANHYIAPNICTLRDAHVLVTGGSSGIGRSVAIEVAKRGANITLFARNMAKLIEAKECIASYLTEGHRVICISVDLSSNYSAVKDAVQEATDAFGPVGMLINCAGFSVARRFEDLTVSDFKMLMDVNYFGTVNVTRAVISDMKQQANGRIVITSSMAGQLGLYGFTAYSGSKFALRGFAESLQMEVLPYNIYVTLAFPADTETPGLAAENIGKPEETKIISGNAGLYKPEEIAKIMLEDALKGKFFSSVSFDGWMLSNLVSGFSPTTSLFEVIQQALTMGIFRLVAVGYIMSFNRIVRQCMIKSKTAGVKKE